jgi:DNA-binding XRE family transcriptional regulator
MDLGLYQADITRMLGVTKDCVGYWERGLTDPHIKYYPAIIAFLGYYPFEHETDSFGGKITKYKHEHGYSNKRLAKLLGVDEGTVAKWGRNDCVPLARSMERVLEVVNKNAAHF